MKLIASFLSGKYQGVLLNGQASSWSLILGGVPQESILGPLVFLIYINGLSHNLLSTAKLSANDTPVFSIVHDLDSSTKQLNDDLKMISDWVYQWKISFNPDLSKQAQEVIFSCKSSRVEHPRVIFSNSSVECVTVADQRVTNNNVIQWIAMPIALIKYLQIKTLNKFIKLN